MVEIAVRFPILVNANDKNVSVVKAIKTIEEAHEVGSIRNADYNEVKRVMSNAILNGWDNAVSCLYLKNTSRNGDTSKAALGANDLYYCCPDSLYAMLSFSKKLEKAKKTGILESAYADFFTAAQNYHDELIGLAEKFRDLKGNIVKGRAPSLKATSVNPDQIRGTCPVCFKVHAVVGGGMARHGYQLPGGGLKTADCPGTGSLPYEVSDEGVKTYIASMEVSIADARIRLAKVDDWKSLTYTRRGSPFPVMVSKGDSDWESRKTQKIKQINAMIKGMENLLPFYRAKVKEWVKKPLLKMDGTLVHG